MHEMSRLVLYTQEDMQRLISQVQDLEAKLFQTELKNEELNYQIADLVPEANIYKQMREEGFTIYDTDTGVERKVYFVHDKGDDSVGIQAHSYWELESLDDD